MYNTREKGDKLTENNGAQLQSCIRCDKIFLFTGVGKCICAKCNAADEEIFNTVKDYIYDHPSAMIKEVAEKTGVKIGRIKSYLKEGRLIISDDSAIFLNCEVCGAQLKFGRVCRNCADTLSNEMKSAMEINDYSIGDKPVNNHGAKMRYF